MASKKLVTVYAYMTVTVGPLAQKAREFAMLQRSTQLRGSCPAGSPDLQNIAA